MTIPRKMGRLANRLNCSVKFYRLLIVKNILGIKSPFVYKHRYSFHILDSTIKECLNINVIWNWILDHYFQRNVTVTNTLQLESMKIYICCIQRTIIAESVPTRENIKIARFCFNSSSCACANCWLYNE